MNEATSEQGEAFLRGYSACMAQFESTLGYSMNSNEERLEEMRSLYMAFSETLASDFAH